MPLLRSATRDDLLVINEIYNHYVLHSTCTFQTVPSTAEERQMWFDSHGEKHPVIVAVEQDTVVGWASLSAFHPRQAYEHSVENSVYLRHDWKGNGLGSLLLKELLVKAKELGHHTVIGLIDASQEASLALHSKFGFKECAHLKEVGFKFGRWLNVIYVQKML